MWKQRPFYQYKNCMIYYTGHEWRMNDELTRNGWYYYADTHSASPPQDSQVC